MSHGILVAARTRTRLGSPSFLLSLFGCSRPAAARWRSDHWIRNSVLDRLEASFSAPDDLAERRESISSTKIIDGARALAKPKSARTSFSLSPCHLDVSVEAETEKKVDLDSVATARASIVFPVPGGPKRSMPRAGSRSPENKSGRRKGYTTASLSAFFAPSKPAISFQCTSSPRTTMSLRI